MKTWRPWLVAATLGAVLAACTDPITAPSGAMRADGLNAVISDPVPSGTQTCPNTGTDGWTKIDANSGSASGA